MARFQLFDSVKLNEAVTLSDGGTAPAESPGAIVEVLGDGDAYLVELFGNWVRIDAEGSIVPSRLDEPEAFVQTLGVETVSPNQISLVTAASGTVGPRVQLLSVVEELSEELVEEVVDFAAFLRQQRRRRVEAARPVCAEHLQRCYSGS